MAKLKAPLLPNQVARLRGVLDYYVTRGVPIVRRWPQKRTRTQTPGERLAQCHMNHALNIYRCSPGWWTEQMQTRLQGFTWNRRDYFMSHYLNPIGGAELSGQGHHPPQPPTCPGGDGHYFALLDAYAIEAGVFSKTMFFVFDRPLKYEMQLLRRHPSTFTVYRRRQGIQHALTALPPLQPPDLGVLPFPRTGPNTYSRFFSQVPGVTDNGDYWAYFRGFDPITSHPAISLTPWFHFTIPPRFAFTLPRAASGITLINKATDEEFDPQEATREPRDSVDYAPCLFDTV